MPRKHQGQYPNAMTTAWRPAVSDADEADVHALVEASDRAAAARSGSPPPVRRMDSTRYLVGQGVVQLALIDWMPMATVTAGPDRSFDPAGASLLPADRPWYMQRLAVRPGCPDPLIGAQAVRRAIAAATEHGCDALHAGANPQLADVLQLLITLGFTRGATDWSGPAPQTFLQLAIRPVR